MKKWILSGGVLAVFIAYSLVLRHQGSESVVVSPKSAASAASGTSKPTGGSAGGSSGSGSNNSGSSNYKNGTYTGSVANAFYGNVQVQAIISGGKLTDVQFLQYPNDNPNSQSINSQATPYLKQEAIQAQSANVNIITGATDTSQAFIQSLTAALSQAQA